MEKVFMFAMIGLILFSGCALQHKDQDVPVTYYTADSNKKLNLPFSDAVRVGNLLFLSGHLGSVPGSNNIVTGGITAETRQALENIKRTLEANGSSLDRVFKCTVMLADMGEWEPMSAVYIEYLPHKPARSAFEASSLALGARVEIECIATVR
jgi:reactive intermediate/imine deaminase